MEHTSNEHMTDARGQGEDDLSAIFAAIPMALLVVDRDRRVVKVNTPAEQFATRDVETMLGLPWGEALQCLHSLDDPRGCGSGPTCQSCGVRLTVLDTFENRRNHYQVEWNASLLRDGRVEERTLLMSTVCLPNQADRVLICVEDITHRKEAENEVRRLNESLARRAAELEASNRELEAFSYSVSHDLRAPVRSMHGFSEILLEDYADRLDEKGKECLRFMQDSSRLMDRLIDDLLKLSRVTRSEMRLEMVDLAETCRQIAGDLQRSQPDRRAEFIIAPGLKATADVNLLRVALENLLGNAWKFTGRTQSALIEVGRAEHGGRQCFFVRDNGAGFDMAYAEKLFRPFQRLHRAADFPGTGVGLATVQRIIRRHGGEIWADGKPGEGATFYFTLG